MMQQRIEKWIRFALLQDRENQNLDEIAQKRAIDNSIEERKVGTSYMVISADFYIYKKGDVIVRPAAGE